MASSRINARTLKGFRDHLPRDLAPRQHMLRQIETVFERYGFAPLQTPALEYAEILLGKYGDEGDKLLYRFADHGDRDVAMRYDLTVPLARVVAQHSGVLPHPLRRYQVAPVWRADKPQRGRFREFLQCDVDIVGSAAVTADAEVIATGLAVLQALGIEGVRLHLNHRDLLQALLAKAGIGQGQTSQRALRAIDKWDKIGADGVRQELAKIDGLDDGGVEALMQMFSATMPVAGDSDAPVDHGQVFEQLLQWLGPTPAIDRLRAVTELVGEAGFDGQLLINPSIARGLDYYTGVIYETRLTDPKVAGIGAVMSGGRYDDLIGMFSKQQVPAVGISLGLDRLLAALRELDLVDEVRAGAMAYVTVFEEGLAGYSMKIAATLRAAGIDTEIDTLGGKLAKQLKRADKRGCRFAAVAGPDESESGQVVIKDMRAHTQATVPLEGAVEMVASLIETAQIRED